MRVKPAMWLAGGAALAVALLLASCAPTETRRFTFEDNLYPLGEGYRWVFSDLNKDTGQNPDRVRTVEGKTTFQSKDAWKVKEVATNGQGESVFDARVTKDGLFVHPFDQRTRKDLERQELKFPLTVGKRWSESIDVYSGGRRMNEPWEYVVTAVERVKVPAGEFEAVRVDTANRAGNVPAFWFFSRTWYAPGVGVVKYQTGGTEEADERILELKSYKVG